MCRVQKLTQLAYYATAAKRESGVPPYCSLMSTTKFTTNLPEQYKLANVCIVEVSQVTMLKVPQRTHRIIEQHDTLVRELNERV